MTYSMAGSLAWPEPTRETREGLKNTQEVYRSVIKLGAWSEVRALFRRLPEWASACWKRFCVSGLEWHTSLYHIL